MTDSVTKLLLPAPAMQNLHDPSGIGHADTLDPQVPLWVRVGPYVTMAAGDIIDLHCDGQLAFNYTVRTEDLIPQTPSFVVLPLDQRFIHPDEITLSYTVTEPVGGNRNESSQNVVAVKVTLPGGTDTNPATPWENEGLALPVVSPQGIIISPEGVSVEIAPYLNMSMGDRITLSWNGEFVRTQISQPAQVGQPVVIPISREIIEKAGDSEMLEVRYEVRDRVNNWSRWSLPTVVEVEAGGSALPAPIAPQAPDMELDLEKLGGADVQVLVISNTSIKAGDQITLLVERNTAEGLPLETYSVVQVVNGPASFIEFSVPNVQFQPIAQGRARLKYDVRKPSGQILHSRSLQLKISGQAMQLAAPRVPVAELNGGVLDPASHNVVAEVPAYYFMAEGNLIHLVWMGKTASGANVMFEAQKTVSSSDVGTPLNFVIPDENVSVLTGGSVQVHYTISTASNDFFRSPTLTLAVEGNSPVELPSPTMDTVESDGVVHPSRIPESGATVRVRYSEMAANDQVVVKWLGASAYETAPQLVGSNTALVFNLPKELITATENGTATLSYRMIRAGISHESEKLQLTVSSSLILDTSPATLNGKVYLLPGYPGLLPSFPVDTTVQRTPSGGQKPYTYASSNENVAHVSEDGLTTARGNGAASISVTDARGQRLAYDVSVTGVIQCLGLGLGGGNFTTVSNAAAGQGARLPSIYELREIHGSYGNRWPIGTNNYWSSTVARPLTPFGKTYYVKNLVGGAEIDAYTFSNILGVGLR